MTFSDRVIAVKGKVRFYRDELVGLKGGGVRYAVTFGLMLTLLFPVLVIEIILLLVIGVDAEINQTRYPVITSEVREEEVPPALRQLIPIAIKWGIGDAEERQNLMNVTSLSELNEIERMVGPRMQQIAGFIDTYSETELRESTTAGHFIFLQLAYDELSSYLEEREA